jgi:hypothetical protein
MSEPLLFDELNSQQQTALANLSHHPGYDVLLMIFNKSCERINARLLKLDPEDAEYDKKVTRLHLISKTVNEFCLSVVKSIQIHEQIAVLSQQMSEQEIRAAIEAAEPRTKPGNPLALAAVALSNKSQVGE